MKIKRFLFSSALLFGAVTFSVGAEEVILKEPVRTTHYIPGKVLVRYKGCVVQVMGYSNGSPQFNLTNPNERFGGLAVSVDGKSVKGTRRDEGKIIHYDFPGGGILTMQIMPDKRVSFEGKFPGAQKLYFEVPMLAKFFSSSRVDIDGTVKNIPARQENPKVNYVLLFKGTPKSVQFFAGEPKAFGFEFDGTTQVRVGHFTKGNNAVVLRIDPANPAEKFSFILDPGTK